MGSAWDIDARFTSVHVPDGDPFRVYYARPDDGTIVSYYQVSVDLGTWQVNDDPRWGTATGDIAAAAWADQVRMFYFLDDELVVSRQNGTVWADPVTIS